MRTPAIVLLITALGIAGRIGPAQASAADTDARDAYAVGVRTDVVVDSSRPTPEIAGPGIAASSERRIPVTTFYPARGAPSATPVADARPARGRFPVILWAHGNGSSGSATPHQVWSWAKQGFVVVAPDFPASSRARSNFEAVADWENQPGDVSFVLDETLRGDGVAGLRGTVDPQHVGVAGHSLGAMTALAAGFGTSADPRIDGVISFSGIPLIGNADVASRPIPLLLLHGGDDPTIPPDQSRSMFAKALGPRALVIVNGGGHSPYLQRPDPDLEESLFTATSRFWRATLRTGTDPTVGLTATAIPGRMTVETARARTTGSAPAATTTRWEPPPA